MTWMTLLGHTVHLLHHMGRNGIHQALQSICQLSEQMCRSWGRHVSRDQTQKTWWKTHTFAATTHYNLYVCNRCVITQTHFTLASGFGLVREMFSTRGDSTVLIRWLVRGALNTTIYLSTQLGYDIHKYKNFRISDRHACIYMLVHIKAYQEMNV